ncbi:DUF4982 domain-containing protein [Bifidobacterium ramosum]|uniref:DUF4982 domain-containing protein n=2 Tax=Bifidobacterium ramosum TaxID=1798158 RepID=A0A7K3TDF3_9BIFI|nr:DUF4982 domain-containing protein [Bifidobacterium ramosum]
MFSGCLQPGASDPIAGSEAAGFSYPKTPIEPRCRGLIKGTIMRFTTYELPVSKPQTTLTETADGRQIIDFDGDWRFFRGSPSGAERPDFDDSAWREVTVPHDFGVEGRFSRNARATVGYLKVGEGWYRKTFTMPAALAGKRFVLDFDGVMDRSEIWLNGVKVGEHHYGYTAFQIDVTDHLHFGDEPNTITVRAVNEEPSSRWYAGAGLYRDITLVVTDPIHVAQYGTQITTPTLADDVAHGVAEVHVATTIANETTSAAAVTLRTTIVDADGSVVAEDTTDVTAVPTDMTGRIVAAPANESVASADLQYAPAPTAEQVLTIAEPHLWNTADPYQYLARTALLAADGTVLDTYETRFGLRWITLDPQRGLFLNGVNMRALGMCMHHDQGALGAAAYHRAVTRQLEIMKEGGVNAIRTSHNPACKTQVAECSRLGLLVLEELTDMWTAPKNRNDYSNYFAADYPEDLKAMILRDRNEPCVFMWGMGNEIAWQEAEIPIAADLTRRCHLLDPTRPNSVNDASYLSKGIDGIGNDIHHRMDVRGYSYISKDKMLEVHEKNPNDVIVNSESANICSNRGYYVYPTEVSECPAVLPPIDTSKYEFEPGRKPWDDTTYELSAYNIRGKRGNYIDVAFERLIHIPFNVGEFGWTGFDYIGEPAPYISNSYWTKPDMAESDGTVLAPLRSYYGMVDTAGIPKDQWYIYKSLWTDPDDAPMVHLLPHWNWSVGEAVSVWAYTNAASAELFLNGRSLGVREFDSFDTDFHLDASHADKPFQYRYAKANPSRRKLSLDWEVPFEPGVIEVVARDATGRIVARDSKATPGSPAALRLSADRHVITGDGKDLSYVTAAVTDDIGVTVPRADDEVTFSVEHGRLLGTDNGSQTNTEPLQSATHRAYSGLVVAIVASDGSGLPIRVTARGKGLKKASCVIAVAGNVAAGDVVDVEPVAVRTVAGVAPTLPETVTVRFGDGSRRAVPVTWDAVDDGCGSAAGAFRVRGAIDCGDGVSRETFADVVVVTVDDVVPVALTVAGDGGADRPVELPDAVTAITSDGGFMRLPVTWDALPDGVDVAGDGVVAVSGTVAVPGGVSGPSCSLTAHASVRILADGERPINEPALRSLRINGKPVADFDPERTEYTLAQRYDQPKPVIEAEAEGNDLVYVLPPANWPNGAYRVHVTSEDGKRGRTYTIGLDIAPAPVANVSIAATVANPIEDAIVPVVVSATNTNGLPIDLDDAHVVIDSSNHAVLAAADPASGQTASATDGTDHALVAVLAGTANVTATVTYGGAVVASAPLPLTVAHGTHAKRPTAVRDVTLRTIVGEAPELPSAATVSFDHGFDAEIPVDWQPVPGDALAKPGRVTVTGTVGDTGLAAHATIVVVAVSAVANVSIATITHIVPDLAETFPTVAVYWSDGLKEDLPVVWDAIDATAVAAPGEFTVEGAVAGVTGRRAVAHVRVTDEHVQNRDLFSFRNDVYPQVRASYTNTDPKAQEDVADLMDGTVSYTARLGYNLKNRWSTAGDPSNTAWLEYRFGYGEETPFMLDSFTVYYCLDGDGVVLPEHVDVEYLDVDGSVGAGSDDAVSWKPVRDLSVTHHPVEQKNDAAWAYATVGDKPGNEMVSNGDETTYSFEMVRTSRIRITFHTDDGEVVAITEVRGDAQIPAVHGDADLAGILVDGEPVAFDPDVETYTSGASGMSGDGSQPAVEPVPVAGSNVAITVVPPAVGSDETRIIVTSEDRVTTRTYLVTSR